VTVSKVGRMLAGAALVLTASACDDNPLAENRDQAAYFRLNPSTIAVNAGGTAKVDAILVNQFGAATNESVSATPCDALITAVADPGRSEFEYPERFVITGGTTYGVTCLVVTGGGITDTINVRVVPATVDLQIAPANEVIESGTVINLPIAYLTTAGTGVQGAIGLDARTTFTVVTDAIGDVDAQGNFTAHFPGATWVRSTFTDLGVTRRDSVRFTVVPAPFTGTVTRTPYSGGEALQFDGGAVPFDADTRVEYAAIGGGNIVHLLPNTATTIRGALPFGMNAGDTITYYIINADPMPGKVWGGEYVLGADAADTDSFGAAANARLTAPLMQENVDVFGTLSTADPAVWHRFVVTTAGDYTMTVDWSDNSDVDAWIRNATGGSVLARATAAKPETGTVTLTPGTYYVNLDMYEAATAGNTYYRIRLTR
jgi:hypothetical protein